MHTPPSLLQMESTPEAGSLRVEGALRCLVSLVRNAVDPDVESCTSEEAEEVLIDTEVDGARYLLIRMPRPAYSRVQLSPREQEIVRMVAQGHPNKVIAGVLNISTWTVCTHLRRIFAKLGVGSRAAMVAKLPELGVIRKDYQPLAHPR